MVQKVTLSFPQSPRFGCTFENLKPSVHSAGTSREDSEPLRTLARERYKHDHKVVFGDLFAVSCPEGTTISSGAVLNRMDS